MYYGMSLVDYKLLKYISKFKSIPKEQLQSKFGSKIESLNVRLSRLINELKYVSQQSDIVIKSGHVINNYKENYIITDKGKAALQDYKTKLRYDAHMMWLKNCWIPILVSLVTSTIIYCILPLLRTIIEWVVHIR